MRAAGDQEAGDRISWAIEPHLLLAVALVAPSVVLFDVPGVQVLTQLLAGAFAAVPLLIKERSFGLPTVIGALVVLVAALAFEVLVIADPGSGWRRVLPDAIIVLCAVVIVALAVRRRAIASAAALAILAVMTVLALGTHPVIDVLVFLRDGAAGLLHGHDPYAMTFVSPYSADQNAIFYSPAVLSGGIVTGGFPYPPVALLGACVGWLLGDVRITGALALAATVVVLHRLRPGPPAALLLLVPGIIWVLSNGWVEPVCVLLLGLTVSGFVRGSRLAPVWLGLLLVSKQYFVVALPLVLLLVRRGADRREVTRTLATAAGTGVLTLLPFAIWDLHGLWRSLVQFQLLQPFRPDSSSLLVWLVNRTGWPPPGVYGVLPLAAGLAVAGVLAWRAPRHPAAFSAALGLTLLTVITLSKQAFSNYWFLVASAMMIAALTWTASERAVPAGEDPA